ncbi:type II toxin-antitoxin system RnlB family antitoxin [Halosquirtibacter laminarini]|uniref:Type II toxin-antitoxin system RnlB family antitoxin n=1 Tax=Halosquirtibacter laminarini TaxID=3374600 RepID=A0AC61NC43_9BACT|nr:type II toxin-antitoxin system RnlB family antitoxin [Prolixibacteraceae bacterium]
MTNSLFHIEEIYKGTILVVPKSYMRTEYYLSELNDFIKIHFSHVRYLIMDLLMKNGMRNRFFTASVAEKGILMNSFQPLSRLDQIVERQSNMFFSNNMHLIEHSSLTMPQRFLFKKKIEKMN